MPSYCSCGAELVPDALFCHKCGRPLREIPGMQPEPEPAPMPAAVFVQAPPVEPPPVNFHNRQALQIGLIMAILATLCSFLVYVNWLAAGAAGFFTVLVYRRRTGYPLDMQAGVRLGWITGILMFVIMTVIFTGAVVFVTSGGLANLPPNVKSSLDPRMQDALQAMQSGPAVAEMIVMLFVFTTLLSMAGGAIGAKIASRGRSN